jgi:hypothetical protein
MDIQHLTNEIKELKLNINVRVPTLQNRIEELEKDIVRLHELSTKDTIHRIDHNLNRLKNIEAVHKTSRTRLQNQIDAIHTNLQSMHKKYDELNKRVCKDRINHQNIEWTVSYLKDIMEVQKLNTLLPQEFGNHFRDTVQSIVDNEVFELLDYENQITKLVELKTVVTCSQYLDTCILCDNLSRFVDDRDDWLDSVPPIASFEYKLYEGHSQKEYCEKRWEEKIQEFVLFLEGLPNKTNTQDEILDMNNGSSPFKTVVCNEIKNKTILHPNNILDEATEYFKTNSLKTIDIVDTIKQMLVSSKYMLSDDFKKNKLDLKDIQFKFKMMTSPETISRDDILAEVFNIDNSISLI